MFHELRKSDQVTGKYLGVEYSGTVRGVRLNERTGNTEVEIDFPAPSLAFVAAIGMCALA